MTELIITEKPATAAKIADALADDVPKKKKSGTVSYFEFTKDGKTILVGSAVGHVYGLAEKEKSKDFIYPVFDVEWRPLDEINKNSKHVKKYISLLKRLAKEADVFTVATDYDIEGEVIGLNVIQHTCNQKDARRMKFSTLTKNELRKSYEGVSDTLEWPQAKAGLARHRLDWYYGINLSRALTSAVKAAGGFKLLSSGRVQGPSLKIIVDREKEISAFKSAPFWEIELVILLDKKEVAAKHAEDKFQDKKKAEEAAKNAKVKEAEITDVSRDEFKQAPPTPFDLTTLQTESYRCHGISPKATLEIAQKLYVSGVISYPRTSSQKLPESLGHRHIINSLSKNRDYTEVADKLANVKLQPNEGKKTDPAHPSIYPTGEKPKKIDDRHGKIYDIIVRRYLATFGTYAVRETQTIKLDAGGEPFITKGTRTKEPGWHVLYGPYVKLKDEELSLVKKGEKISVKETNLLDKETQPPKRFTPASIIRALEKKNLGTKSTRAQIVDTLSFRGYAEGVSLEATELGIHTIDTLQKYCPKVIDEKLTRHFEQELEDIREGNKTTDDVLNEATDVLTDILAGFKKNEKKIGKGLLDALKVSREKASTVGNCPICKKGKLMVKRGKFGRFIACSDYPKCKSTFNLPNTGMIKTSDKECESCNHPQITVIRKAKKPQTVCINPDCKLKAISEEVKEQKCEKCKDGKLILRKSIYGSFLGCSSYPKCRNTKKLAKVEE